MTTVFAFPGQGSQRVGMGEGLFERFPLEVAEADLILGYSIKDLCLLNEGNRLDKTEYTQPALYVVNALHYLAKIEDGESPDYVIGHSLGEYNALFAAGAFDFGTGLRIVQKRGELMSQAKGGGMAAVVGLLEQELRAELANAGFDQVDIANLNSPTQIVISGPLAEVERATEHLKSATDAHVVTLRVSGAFHSRYMEAAEAEFIDFLGNYEFNRLAVPLLSNAFARPYDDAAIAQTLAKQITSPVRWTEIVLQLLSFEGVQFVEVGPGKTLSALIRQVKSQAAYLAREEEYNANPPMNSMVPPAMESGILPAFTRSGERKIVSIPGGAAPANDVKVA